MTKQWVYRFSEGKKEQKMLLGGKGANLAEMTNLGLLILPGFTITTESASIISMKAGRFGLRFSSRSIRPRRPGKRGREIFP